MTKDTINSYLINFRRFITPFLKPDVSIRFITYPFKDGAVLVSEFDMNGNNNTEYRADSSTLNEAIAKTNLFDKPNELQPINNTKIIIGNGKVVIIKGTSASWTEKEANEDVNKFLSSISGK